MINWVFMKDQHKEVHISEVEEKICIVYQVWKENLKSEAWVCIKHTSVYQIIFIANSSFLTSLRWNYICKHQSSTRATDS